MVDQPIASILTPSFCQGEITEKPNPKPRINKINVITAALTAPANIAAQETLLILFAERVCILFSFLFAIKSGFVISIENHQASCLWSRSTGYEQKISFTLKNERKPQLILRSF